MQLVPPVTDKSPVNPWMAYAAAAWAFVFAVFHLIWAAGWYVGLDAEKAKEMFAVPWKFAYDLVIAAMCVIAIPVAVAFVQPWGRHLPRKLFGAIAWFGTSLLVLRGAGSFIQTAYLVVTGQFAEGLRSVLWELWFYLGSILWGFSLWRFWRVTSKQKVQND